MRVRHWVEALAACGALLGGTQAAQADTVLYDGANFVSGQQSFTQSFTLSTAGTLTISLQSVPWLDTVHDLNCFLTTASGVFGANMQGGENSMALAAGTYFAHWFGTADGAYKLGVDQLKITFQSDATPVPIPPSLLLMLAGLGVLFGWQGRESGSAPVRLPFTNGRTTNA